MMPGIQIDLKPPELAITKSWFGAAEFIRLVIRFPKSFSSLNFLSKNISLLAKGYKNGAIKGTHFVS